MASWPKTPLSAYAVVAFAMGMLALTTRPELAGFDLLRWSMSIAALAALALAANAARRWLRENLNPVQPEELPQDEPPQDEPPQDEPQQDPPPHEVKLFLVALLAVLAAFNVYAQLSDLLQGFHESEQASFGLNVVSSPRAPWDQATELREALDSWSAFARSSEAAVKDRNAPLTVITWGIGVDTVVLIPALVALLGLLILWESRTLRRFPSEMELTTTKVRVDAYQGMAGWAAWLLLVGAACDLLENWLALTAVREGWFGLWAEPPAVIALLHGIVTWFKLLGFGLAIGAVVVIGLFLARNAANTNKPWEGFRGGLQAVIAVRMQLVVLTLLAAALLLHEQVPDAIRRWTHGFGPPVAALALTLLLAVGIWHSSRWMLAAATAAPDATKRADWALAVGAIVVLLGIGVPQGWWPGSRAIFLVAVVVVACFMNRAVQGLDIPLQPPGWGTAMWPSVLASATVTVVALAVLRASASDFVYSWMQRAALMNPGVLLALALGLLGLVAVLSPVWANLPGPAQVQSPVGRRAPIILVVCLLTWMAVLAALTHTVHVVAPALGSIGVVLAFCLLLAYTGSSMIATVNRLVPKPRLLFATTGLRRIPVLSLVLVWFLLASLFSFGERLHDVLPEADDRAQPKQGIRLAAVFNDWVRRHCLEGATDSQRRELPAVPLVFVASSGGGVRAAVWTSLVLENLFGSSSAGQASQPAQGTDPSCANASDLQSQLASRHSWVIAASGVSGGSLGIATWAAKLAELKSPGSTPGDDETAVTQADWIETRLGEDFVAPSLAWMLFMEAPWSLLGFNADRDRAAVLEESWERAWPDEPGLRRHQVGSRGLRQGLFGLRTKHPELPVLLFNGTSVESGCRFNASVLASDGRPSDDPSGACVAPRALVQEERGVLAATVDLHDFLCGEDLRLSKAVLLSARFPVISPSGHLKQCASGDAASPETFVVDGGYLENSGAASALELWTSLASKVEQHNASPRATACVVPFLVQIDNGWGEPAAPGPVAPTPQFQVPLATAQATRNARAASARQAAKLVFDEPFTSGGTKVLATTANGDRSAPSELASRYAHFSLQAHPGAKAPLGWTLSRQSLEDMKEQLGKRPNEEAKSRVDQWFNRLTCRR